MTEDGLIVFLDNLPLVVDVVEHLHPEAGDGIVVGLDEQLALLQDGVKRGLEPCAGCCRNNKFIKDLKKNNL